MKTKDLFIGAFALIMAGVLAYLWFTPGGLKEAPGVSLTTLDGRQLQLAELRGRPVLVTFWATSCPGCVKEMPHLVELYHELAPKGFEIVAFAMAYDPPEQVREMAARRELPYPVAVDSSGEAARAFGDVRLTPTHFLIDPQGRIVQQKIGELDMVQLRTRIVGMLGNV
jgi:peroxiredoxin